MADSMWTNPFEPGAGLLPVYAHASRDGGTTRERREKFRRANALVRLVHFLVSRFLQRRTQAWRVR